MFYTFRMVQSPVKKLMSPETLFVDQMSAMQPCSKIHHNGREIGSLPNLVYTHNSITIYDIIVIKTRKRLCTQIKILKTAQKHFQFGHVR